MRKALICGVFVAFCCIPCAMGASTDIDKGAAKLVLQSTIDMAKPAKPASFPHGAHQARLECKTCHHGKTAEGKRLSYAEGHKIEKCESCHNSKAGISPQLASFKNAAHTLCQGCHRKNNPDLVNCAVCHKKQPQALGGNK
ncbi:MAG: cytochrome c family protein [Desulfobulbus sp.]|nr:cytochrome c family protein [Desulfobulbus sp.]